MFNLKIDLHAHPQDVGVQWCELEQLGGCTVFQRFDWCSMWFDAVAKLPGVHPFVLTVSEAQPHGRCLMVLPLVCRTVDGLRTVGFADLGVCDYNAPLKAPDFAPTPSQLRQLWRRIRRVMPPHDVLFFEKMPLHCAQQPNVLVHLPGVALYVESAAGVELNLTKGADIRAHFLPKFAENMIARTRKLGKRANVRFAFASDTATQARYMELFTRNFAEKSAANPAFNDVLGHPTWGSLYQASLQGAAPVGRVGALLVDEQEAALCFGFVYRNRFHLILHTYLGNTWRNYSPGLQLIERTMQWALDEGLEYFDFTLGAESYKLDFGCTEVPLYQMAQAGSLKGFWPVLKLRAKGYLRSHPQLQQWLKRWAHKLRQ